MISRYRFFTLLAHLNFSLFLGLFFSLLQSDVEISFDLFQHLRHIFLLLGLLNLFFPSLLFFFPPHIGFPPYPIPTPGLHQSCRHVVRSWANQSFGAHLHNMTLSNGKLRVPQDGRYYLYSQVTIPYLQKYYLFYPRLWIFKSKAQMQIIILWNIVVTVYVEQSCLALS